MPLLTKINKYQKDRHSRSKCEKLKWLKNQKLSQIYMYNSFLPFFVSRKTTKNASFDENLDTSKKSKTRPQK
jgi:hypothetical protein